MTTTRNQFPQGYQISNNGIITDPYYFFLKGLNDSLPPAGSGYVVDGSFGTTGLQMTQFWGLDSLKGTPVTDGYIYFATDTGKIYVSQGSSWVLESPAYTGSVIKAVGSTTTVLSNVLANPGTYGATGTTPQLTVNAEGRIIAIMDVPNATSPGGNDGDVQFNNAGLFGGVDTFHYDSSTDTLEVNNELVDGQITFVDPIPTRTNLLPTQTGNAGDALLTDGTDVHWGPVGTVTSVDIASPGSTITVGGGPITTAGTLTVDLPVTGVSAGSYTNTNITVDAEGRITAASNGTAGTVTNVTASAPLSSTGGTTPNISITLADTTTDGYLSSVDWNTFNNKGSGSVTSVDVSGANGILSTGGPITTSGVIALDLGNITPLSVAATGTVTGSNLSGTNTGDQTITLTGDITGSGTGTFATTYAGVLGTSLGGTNLTGYTTGDLLYASSSSVLSKRTIGTNGQVLTVSGGLPVWAASVTGAAGNNTNVQFNNSGAFAGDDAFSYAGAGELNLGANGIGSGELLLIDSGGNTNGAIQASGSGLSITSSLIGAASGLVETRTAGTTGNTGQVRFLTGNSSAGNSGSISFTTGSAAGSIGSIVFNSNGGSINSLTIDGNGGSWLLNGAGGGAGQVLTSNGSGTPPIWTTPTNTITTGSATFAGGVVTISTGAVTSASVPVIAITSLGTVTVATAWYMSARVASSHFTITSANPLDTSTFSWLLIN